MLADTMMPEAFEHGREIAEWARTRDSWTAILRRVIRSLPPVAAVAALLAISPGCAGDDEPEVCRSLQDLQASV